jgi:hypothetical protein
MVLNNNFMNCSKQMSVEPHARENSCTHGSTEKQRNYLLSRAWVTIDGVLERILGLLSFLTRNL